LNFFC